MSSAIYYYLLKQVLWRYDACGELTAYCWANCWWWFAWVNSCCLEMASQFEVRLNVQRLLEDLYVCPDWVSWIPKLGFPYLMAGRDGRMDMSFLIIYKAEEFVCLFERVYHSTYWSDFENSFTKSKVSQISYILFKITGTRKNITWTKPSS